MTELTAERLRELLDYDAETGVFKWRKPPRARVIDGPAGKRSGPYVVIGISQRLYYAHRLAWLYVYGEWPAAHLDHVNGDGRDNRIANIRQATRSENLCNHAVRRDSTVGLKGVSPKRSKFSAQIKKNGVRYCLGDYDTPEEAHTAYCNAARELHGEFARTT